VVVVNRYHRYVSEESDPHPRGDQRGRIIACAARLLEEGGAAAVTTRAVADGADVQPPTIYRLFGDKDGLLDAVAEDVMARFVAEKAREPEADDPVDQMRSGWRRQIEFGLKHPDLTRLMASRSRPSPAIEAGIRVLQARIHRMASAGLLVVSEQRALDMFHAAGAGAVQSLLESSSDARDNGLADALFEAVLGATTRPSAVRDELTSTVPIANAFAAIVPDLPGLSDAERLLMSEWIERAIRGVEG